MKRAGGLFDSLASFENIYLAYLKARRGKRHRESVDRFGFHLEGEILRLQKDLEEGRYEPGRMMEFTILDPKRRKIHASPFRDRVLHHAILNVTEGVFERALDHDSYACRKGKGTDAALRRAVVLSRRGGWVLKTDVETFFATVDHGILKGLLERRFKDQRLLDLLGRIIDHGGACARGLPIGNLTSQWFANLYLGPLDRFVRERVRPRGYIRYMDDFALVGGSREGVQGMLRGLAAWLRRELKLELKQSATHIHETPAGWPFLGFRVFPSGLRVHPRSWRLWKKRHQATYHDYERGRVSLEDLVRSTECRIAHLQRARCDGLQRKEMRWAEL